MDQVESKADYDGDLVRQWMDAIALAGKRQKDWEERGQKVIDRYRDERDAVADKEKRFNILWSNIETLRPAVFSNQPIPVVTRRFKDPDPVGRAASEVLERALKYSADAYDFTGVLKSSVEDYLLPGRGMSRVIYEPTYGDPEPALDEMGQMTTYTPVVYEEAKCKYQFWKDVRLGPGRCWEELPWVAYRSYMRRDELVERFGELGQSLSLDYKPNDVDDDAGEQFKQAVVWEIWSKTDKQVLWIAESHKSAPLEVSAPPLDLHGFFPSPKPLFSLVTNDNLIPVPDYCQYQDQAEELDRLSARIDVLLDALKVAGFYAGEEKDNIARLFTDATENQLIAVESWAMWAEKGGIKGMVDWYPTEQVARVVVGLYEAREKTKQELYEITGLSDIIRGASDSKETATAQRIKGQFATMRLKERQQTVQEYARDLYRLKAEVICEQFSPETLQMMTGLQYEEEQWQQVVDLLRNDPLRSFRIDIETDSTIQPDEQADKDSRIEFLTATTQFIDKAAVIGQQAPALMPLMGEMLMFAVRGFRTGRDLEQTFEQALNQMQQQPTGPQPEDATADREAALKERELEIKNKELDIKDREIMAKAAESQDSNALERDRMMNEHKQEMTKIGAENIDQVSSVLAALPALMAAISESQRQGAESAQQNAELIAEVVSMNQENMARIAEVISAPKRLLRDGNGRPVGVETVN